MKSLRLVIFALLFLSVTAFSAKNAHALTVGIDKESTSFGVVYWNKSMSTNKLQITNTNTQESVWIRLDSFDSQNGCVSFDNIRCMTPVDTDIYDDSELLISALTGHEGFITYNAVESIDNDNDGVDCVQDTPTFVPRDFPFLISTHWIHSDHNVTGAGDDGGAPSEIAVAYNGAGRNFNGTAFDTIAPLNIMAPHNDNVSVNSIFSEDINFVTVTWRDHFFGRGAYIASGGTVVATGNANVPQGIFSFDDIETGSSCGNWSETCASCKGISADSQVDEGESVCSLAAVDITGGIGGGCGGAPDGTIDPTCDKAPDDVVCNSPGPHDGVLSLIGVTATNNVINLIGPENSNEWAGIDYAVVLGDPGPIPPRAGPPDHSNAPPGAGPPPGKGKP